MKDRRIFALGAPSRTALAAVAALGMLLHAGWLLANTIGLPPEPCVPGGPVCAPASACFDATCDAAGACVQTPKACDDGNPCTDTDCDNLMGCLFTPISGACDDGDPCSENDFCEFGQCVSGDPVFCFDFNDCTFDFCDEDEGCINFPIEGPCGDGGTCSPDGTCVEDVCAGLGPDGCDDGNPCTVDTCDAAVGCVYTAAGDGTACDDDNLCTGPECVPPVEGLVTRYIVSNANSSHGIWLPGFNDDDTSHKVRMTFEDDSFFDVFADGSGHMHGTAFVSDLGGGPGDIGETWALDLTYAFRGVGPDGEGSGGPKKEMSNKQPPEVTDLWQYFDLDDSTATLTNIETGEIVEITQFPLSSIYPFQVGFTASGKNENFGGAMWLQYQRSVGEMSYQNKGDINIDLDEVAFCPTPDQCIAGECVGGDPPVCDDGKICTVDKCNPIVGCTFNQSQLQGQSCDDGDPCTLNDVCDAGFCVGEFTDEDADGVADACDNCPFDPANDLDGDGICGDADLCPGTVIPEPNIPSKGTLKYFRWALMDADTEFDTKKPAKCESNSKPWNWSKCKTDGYSIQDTAGCSCGQILKSMEDAGFWDKWYVKQSKWGCTQTTMQWWTFLVSK